MPTRIQPRFVLSVLLAVVLLAAAGCASEPPPNLVFIVVDTLRADRLGCYGAERETTPAIDALAARAVRFHRAYATAPWTRPSIASMLTGLYPTSHGASTVDLMLPDSVATLAGMLQAEGWATAGVISHGVISRRAGFARGFDHWQQSEARGHEHISTAGVTGQALEQLDRLAGGAQPFFLFVHYFDPHYFWHRHDDADFAADSAGRLNGRQSIWQLRGMRQELTGEELAFIRDTYDEEVRHTDGGVGRLLERLGELGLESDTVVVFTADHGEEFMEHGWIGHTRSLYEELVRVPLIIRVPGAAPAVVHRPVSLVSLVPTLLDLLCGPCLDEEYTFQGPSLAPLIGGEEANQGEGDADAEGIFFEVSFDQPEDWGAEKTAHKKGILLDGWKLIRDEAGGGLELYNLEQDPGETANLAQARPGVRDRLLARLEARVQRLGTAVDAQRLELDERELEQLRGLGYLED